MTPQPDKLVNRRVLLLYATGFYLLAIVLLAPDAGHWQGRSFFQVARESPWDRWWDWAAAWCSVKVMLLSLGVASLMAALGLMLKLAHREAWGRAVLFLVGASSLGLWLGLYYLAKALL